MIKIHLDNDEGQFRRCPNCGFIPESVESTVANSDGTPILTRGRRYPLETADVRLLTFLPCGCTFPDLHFQDVLNCVT